MHPFSSAIFTALLMLGLPNLSVAQQNRQRIKQPPLSSQTNENKEELIARLEKAILRLMKEGDVPGLSIAIIRNAEVSWHRGFGVKNSDTKEAVDDNTVFEAGSLSKPVFAYAVLKMVEGGKLDLDTPLDKYLPGYLVENDNRINQITARRVLTHTAGFPNWRPSGKPLRIYFTPGERFSYSGEGFVYLQKVIEHLSGEPLDALMKRSVFEPLGMMNSSYVWQEKYESLKAYAHNPAGDVTGRNRPQANAAASLHTTAHDYAKFIAAILNRVGIKENTVREMLKAQIKTDEKCAVCVERAGGGQLSSSIAWGLGWGLQQTAGGYSFWHWGDNGNMKSYVVASDRTKAGIVIFANSANGLSIADEIVAQAGAGKQPSLKWLDYEPYDSPARTLLRDVLAGGDKAIAGYEVRGKMLAESQATWVGRQLLGKKRFAQAIRIFELNAGRFPESSNAFACLGEAYLKAGNGVLAVKNYQHAVELNPQNTDAANILKRLQNSRFKVPSDLLESYAGHYDTPFGIFSVVKEGDRLSASVSGEPGMILLPLSETQFVSAIEGFQFTFARNVKGEITHMVILARGQKIEAKRVTTTPADKIRQ